MTLQLGELRPDLIQALKDQMLICFVKRERGKVTMSAAEIDGTGQDILDIEYDAEHRAFVLTWSKKQ